MASTTSRKLKLWSLQSLLVGSIYHLGLIHGMHFNLYMNATF
ncbi:hypothetical protein PVAP13_4NG214811 [Panicum virgatum]|uniref:Uncharacterized protein n=1 Tax=Panicum virgatum TaxID=38727 RepID=A0A8T0TDV6_PANVG|nr:hypothetical protein PVAP13_4NG214811 [Panicum virgatum]